MSASGSTWRLCRSEISTTRRRASAMSRIRSGPARRLDPEHDVLGDGEDGDQHEVLVDHADPGRDRVARVVEGDGLAVDEDLALVVLVQPVEDVHQRRLAGAVLAEQGVDLAGLDRQVDVLVGDDPGEALRDPAELEPHRVLPSLVGRQAAPRRTPPVVGARPLCEALRGREVVRDLDLAGDDLGLQGGDAVLELLRNRCLELVERAHVRRRRWRAC